VKNRFGLLKDLIVSLNFVSLARPTSRACFFWEVSIILFSTCSLVENNIYSQYILPFLFLLDPKIRKLPSRAILSFASILAIPFGSALLIFILLLWGTYRATPFTGLFAAGGIFILGQISPYLLTLMPSLYFKINFGSIIFLILQILLPLILIIKRCALKDSISFLVILLALIIFSNLAASGGWVTAEIFTSELFRVLAIWTPIIIFFFKPWITINEENNKNQYHVTSSLIFLIAGFVITHIFTPITSIKKVLFDESHGVWETTKQTFNPNDFGRNHTYTYGLLYSFAETLVGKVGRYSGGKLELDGSTLFVIKMPTKILEEPFKKNIITWVRGGGRLLIVADHTDLYDSTQILNSFLSDFLRVNIGTNAVYDKKGLPNKVTTKQFQRLLGQIDSDGNLLPYQTGSAFDSYPFEAASLASYGLSFSEPGDYSKPNRFGNFRPKLSYSYGNHPSVISVPMGKGAISVITDSTPWSNFAVFKKSYKALFKNILGSLETPYSLIVRSISIALLSLFLILLLFVPIKSLLLISSFILGCGLSANTLLTRLVNSEIPITHKKHIEVILGLSAKLEILPQLIAPGERAYPRIISSLGKYGLEPISLNPGITPKSFNPKLTNWLLIEPNVGQLPNVESLHKILLNEGNFIVLFGPQQSQDLRIKKWINQLGLVFQKREALGFVEDSRPGLLYREGAKIIKDIRVATSSLPSSMLASISNRTVFQEYKLRTKVDNFPELKGNLVISFAADQFSDQVVGDVWEGTDANSIGKIREKEISMFFLEEDDSSVEKIAIKDFLSDYKIKLNSFNVLEDGKVVLSGKIKIFTQGQPIDSLGINPDNYLINLQALAFKFINSTCKEDFVLVKCKKHLIGQDMTEWMVAYTQNKLRNKINHLELIHAHNFSGIGHTYNIIFSK
jgi:hypothetical protein